MKEVFNEELGVWGFEPETALEAVQQLEDFLVSDFGQPDWSIKFLVDHFKICKDTIKKVEK